MKALGLKLWQDETGMVLSAELIIICTVVVLGLIVGLAQVQNALVTEMQGLAAGFSSLNQSFAFTGFRGCLKPWGRTSWTAGSFFIDTYGTCVGTGGAVCAYAEICAGSNYGYGYGVGGPMVGGAVTTPAETPCTTCVPDAVVEPCVNCPTNQGTLPPAPKPEIPQGPAPQNLPQQ